ncbi:MAG: hypothetical protein PWQ09_1454 [Candidatus Cloacimonadota bacterium]|jgi:hypothetical protein|nr:hypothetical protein [Candidatus Cloacimonadota bacterium]
MKKIKIFQRDFYELTGCIHNHSIYSQDSSTPIQLIVEAAAVNKLDYFTLTDHMNFAAKQDEVVQNTKTPIIIVGAEINDPKGNNHLLVFNTDKILETTAEEYVQKYKEIGAITFAAHPFEKRVTSKLRKYIWTNKKNDKFDGLEIWNGLSDWVGKIRPNINGLLFLIFPSLFIKKPSRAAINYWDKLNLLGKRKAAIGSVDAHHDSYTKFGIKFRYLSHKFFFKTIRTNIFIPVEKKINQKSILEALKNGNSYIVNYKNGYPYKFFAGISNQKKTAILGEEIEFSPDLKFYYYLPKIAKVKLRKNGQKVDQQRDEKGFFSINSPGNYRLEISNWGRGWIYTNNIYVK